MHATRREGSQNLLVGLGGWNGDNVRRDSSEAKTHRSCGMPRHSKYPGRPEFIKGRAVEEWDLRSV